MFETLREYLNQDFNRYILEWFPNVNRLSNTTWKTGDFNDKVTKNKQDGSLVFNLIEKYAKDFSTGETAGDIISIYAKRFCAGDNKIAFKEIVKRYSLEFLFARNEVKFKNGVKEVDECDIKQRVIKDDKKNRIKEDEEVDGNTENTSKQVHFNKKPTYRPRTQEDVEKDNKIKNILSKITSYGIGDPVDLYFKSRGIKKYSPDTKILNMEKMAVLVNLCKDKDGISINGLQEIFLTKDGKKRDNGVIPTKIQRAYSNKTISACPVRLGSKGENNGYIYITEGVENGLSLQESINNEVWCSLTISNLPTLPFENDKVYIFVFDNDFGKLHKVPYSLNLENKLKDIGVKYKRVIETKKEENTDNNEILEYDIGEFNLKSTITKLEALKQKHFFYLQPTQNGYDANDLLKENKLGEFLAKSTPVEIKNECVLKLNKKTGDSVYWRPQKHYGTNDNNNDSNKNSSNNKFNNNDLIQELITIPYDNHGIAIRFLKRYGHLYRKVEGIGICKYDGLGKYEQKKEDDLFNDIQQTIFMTYYEYDYLLDKEQLKSFKKLWIERGVGEWATVNKIEEYIKRLSELNTNIIDFDNENDNIINVANGYYDLEKGKLFEHTNNKLFFRKLNTNFKSSLNLSNINNEWNKFLLSTFCEKINGDYYNDKAGLEKIRFLQKAVGYTFSTSIDEEKLFIVKGITRSGKNTFLDTIQEVMKDYCGDTQDEEFITSKEQNNNYLLSIRASLKGKRFLHISEISKNKKLNGAQIKRLVGNRNITAKYMHQNSFSYRQQTKYWIATNNIDFTEFDDSIKTKLFIIDFNKRFYEVGTEEAIKTRRVIDRKLKDKLITQENKEFILKWIIDGYRIYKEEGLNQTREMQEALEQIEIDNDTMGMYIKDSMKEFDVNTQSIDGGQANIHEVYKYYREYEISQYGTPEENIIGLRKFIKNLRNRGFDIQRKYNSQTGQNYYITGWCLNNEIVKTILPNVYKSNKNLNENSSNNFIDGVKNE